jgi:hypothetical protein
MTKLYRGFTFKFAGRNVAVIAGDDVLYFAYDEKSAKAYVDKLFVKTKAETAR